MNGHRTYSDPNPRLMLARETVWRTPYRRGHRMFSMPVRPKASEIEQKKEGATK